MPMHLQGSCHCGAVRFGLASHTPVPYQFCYCSVCRKTGGGGGYAVNIGGIAETLEVEGADRIGTFSARIAEDGETVLSRGQRKYCRDCGTALWVWDPRWPELIHPFASAIDTRLPVPPVRTHIFLASKPAWVEPDIRPGDLTFDGYPEASLEDWHRAHGLWID